MKIDRSRIEFQTRLTWYALPLLRADKGCQSLTLSVRNIDVSVPCADSIDNLCDASLSFSYTLFLRHVRPPILLSSPYSCGRCSYSVNNSGLPPSRLSFAKVKGVSDPSWVIPLSSMHVAVHTTREGDSLPRKGLLRSQVSLDEQLHVEAHRLGSEEDIYSSKEKVTSIADSPV
jgi:hypothetical protein